MHTVLAQLLTWWSRLGKPKMKGDGANEEDWVTGLADLVGYGTSSHNIYYIICQLF